jgi:hypothetical protein
MLPTVMKSPRACTLGLALLAAACTTPDPRHPESFNRGATSLRYEAPVSQGESGRYFRVTGASRAEAVAGIVERLTGAGFTDLRIDARAGRVSGTTSSPDVLDCGTFVVTTGNHRTRLAGTTADAALPRGAVGTGGLERREFRSRSAFTVQVTGIADAPGFAARVSERHKVKVVRTAIAQDEPPATVRTQFSGDEDGMVGGDETCRSSGSIRRVLIQP